MLDVVLTETFQRWLASLKDEEAADRIRTRIVRLRSGLLGDVEPIAGPVSELRIHYGPGYRLYITRKGRSIVILLCGGDKRTQAKDIKLAKKLAAELE